MGEERTENFGFGKLPSDLSSLSTSDLKQFLDSFFFMKFGPGALPNPGAMESRRIVVLLLPDEKLELAGPVIAHGYYALVQDGCPSDFVLLFESESLEPYLVGELQDTPFGTVAKDASLYDSLRALCRNHIGTSVPEYVYHHILFVQAYCESPRISVLAIPQQLGPDASFWKEFAERIQHRNIVVLALASLSHGDPHHRARHKDWLTMEMILKLDGPSTEKHFTRLRLKPSGKSVLLGGIELARLMGAKQGHYIRYATTFDLGVSDNNSVIGLAALALVR